jgi:hypothetical protein
MECMESKAAFPLGEMVLTSNAANTLHPEDISKALQRHAQCDWGECCKEDAEENDLSLREGFRLLSVYRDRKNMVFWIITEADRSVTTVLLPEDY